MSSPTQLGRYRLLSRLATGGMGEVYLARHDGPAGFAKTVVVKRILPFLASDLGFVEMFLNEARLAALLTHPNVVQIFELGSEGDEYFIAMEYVHGRSLHAVLERLSSRGERLTPALAARIGSQLLQGLHYAHQRRDEKGRPLGIVHRDVSPDNVLIGFEGSVKVADFGIARATGGRSGSGPAALKGKRAYVAPELLLGGEIDARTDVFMTGVLLYQAVTGRLPFPTPPPGSSPEIQWNSPPVSLRQIDPGIPEVLESILMRALAQAPSDRFDSAEQMSHALEHHLHESHQVVTSSNIASLLGDLFGAEASGAPEGVATVGPPATRQLTGVLSPEVEQPRSPTAAPAPRSRRAWMLWLGVGSVAAGTALWASVAPSELVSPPPAPRALPAPSSVVAAIPPAPKSVLSEAERKPEPATPKRRLVAARSAAARTGALSVRVNPWAEVFYKDRSLGISPVGPIEVPAGRVQLVLRNPELDVERTVTVEVEPGREKILKEDLLR